VLYKQALTSCNLHYACQVANANQFLANLPVFGAVLIVKQELERRSNAQTVILTVLGWCLFHANDNFCWTTNLAFFGVFFYENAVFEEKPPAAQQQ